MRSMKQVETNPNIPHVLTMHVKVDVGIRKVILIMIYTAACGMEIPDSREKVVKLVKDFITQHGNDGFNYVSDVMKHQHGALCAFQAQSLFPDLAAGVDLSGYQVTRVTEVA